MRTKKAQISLHPCNLISAFGKMGLQLKVITKTCLYNIDPLKPHFYTVKLGFTGVYIIFLISAQKHSLWYSLEPPRRGGSNEYPQVMFLSRIMKNIRVFIVKFSVFGGEIVFIYLNRRVFVMCFDKRAAMRKYIFAIREQKRRKSASIRII